MIDDQMEKITIEIKNKKFDTPEKFYNFLEQNFKNDVILHPIPGAENFSKQNLGYTNELDQTINNIKVEFVKVGEGRRLLIGIDAASGTGKTHFLDQLALKLIEMRIYVIRISFNNITIGEIDDDSNLLVNRLVFELILSAKKETNGFESFRLAQTFGKLTFTNAVATLKKYFQFSSGVILIDDIAKIKYIHVEKKLARNIQRSIIDSIKLTADALRMVSVFTTFEPGLLGDKNQEKLKKTYSSHPLLWVNLPRITNLSPLVIFEKSSFFSNHSFEAFQELLKIGKHEFYLNLACAFVSGHARSYEALALTIGIILNSPSKIFTLQTLFSAIKQCYTKYNYKTLHYGITYEMITILIAIDLSRKLVNFQDLEDVNFLTDLDKKEPLPWVDMIAGALLLNSINDEMQCTVLNLAQLYFIISHIDMKSESWFTSLADLTNIEIIGGVREDWLLYEQFHLKYESLRWNIFYELLTLKSITTVVMKDKKIELGKYKFTVVEVDGDDDDNDNGHYYQWSIPIKEWFLTGLESKQCTFDDNDVLLFTSPLQCYNQSKVEAGKKELFTILKNNPMKYLLSPANWAGFDSAISFIRYNTATKEKRPLFILFENKSGTSFKRSDAEEKLNKISDQYQKFRQLPNERITDCPKDVMVMFVAFKCDSNVLPNYNDCSKFGGVGILRKKDLQEYYGSFSRYLEVLNTTLYK